MRLRVSDLASVLAANLPLSDEFDNNQPGLQWQFYNMYDTSRIGFRNARMVQRHEVQVQKLVPRRLENRHDVASRLAAAASEKYPHVHPFLC